MKEGQCAGFGTVAIATEPSESTYALISVAAPASQVPTDSADV